MEGPASPPDAVNPQPAQSSIASTRIQLTVSGEREQVIVQHTPIDAHRPTSSQASATLTPYQGFSYRE